MHEYSQKDNEIMNEYNKCHEDKMREIVRLTLRGLVKTFKEEASELDDDSLTNKISNIICGLILSISLVIPTLEKRYQHLDKIYEHTKYLIDMNRDIK